MNHRGNVLVGILLVFVIGAALFLSVPTGGRVGLFREATISFMFRKPPRFISIQVDVDRESRNIKAGEVLEIKGDETIMITKIRANTFFESYLTADIPIFGESNDLNEPIAGSAIRKQMIDAGIDSIPIDICYIGHEIAKVPLVIHLNREDFIKRIEETKDEDEKIAILLNAHASFKEDDFFLEDLTRRLKNKGDYNALVNLYRPIVEADPDNVSAMAALSRYYIKLGLYEDAYKESRKIVDKGRATINTYRRLAFLAGQMGMLEERIKYLNDAIRIDPANDSVILDLGNTYEQSGNSKKALNLYYSIAETAENKKILVPVIEDAIKNKAFKKASRVLKRYVGVYPEEANAHAKLGMVMGKLGHRDEQIKYYRKAVTLSPQDAVLVYNLANIYDKAGKKQKALKGYLDLLRLNPKNKDALARAAELSFDLGHYDEAYGLYSSLVKKDSKKRYLKGFVSASVGLKDDDRIIRACARYLKRYQDYNVALTKAYAHESRAAKRTGRKRLEDMEEALNAYRLALKCKPESQKAQEKIPELRIDIMRFKRLI